jgi:dihydrofolate reductase
MRKLIVFNMISLDGFFAGLDGDISWHNTDEEFGKFASEQTAEFGTLIFGRKTYDIMASYWPTEQGVKDDPIVANLLNTLPKIVYSKSLQKIEEIPNWKNVRLFHEIDPEEVKKLKKFPGKDIAIFGSGEIVQQFTNLNLIDEYWLMVAPLVLGKGKPLFTNIKEKLNLKLLKTRTFKNGNVMLYYKRV